VIALHSPFAPLRTANWLCLHAASVPLTRTLYVQHFAPRHVLGADEEEVANLVTFSGVLRGCGVLGEKRLRSALMRFFVSLRSDATLFAGGTLWPRK
jgi:hypothetical protein